MKRWISWRVQTSAYTEGMPVGIFTATTRAKCLCA